MRKSLLVCLSLCLCFTAFGQKIVRHDQIVQEEDLAPIKKDIADLSALVIGDDCQLVSTNYDSKVHMPSLFMRFKIKNEETGSNDWQVVWREMTRWDWLLDTYLPTNYLTKSEVEKELDNKADRAWGFYDSHTGEYAPEGYTWISSPKVAVAGGMAYQRVVTSEGAIFVLCSNGLNTELGNDPASTNGFFRITDDKGNAVFEITKGTETIVGATASSLTTESVNGITHLRIAYDVESSEHPKLEICRVLTASEQPEWKEEGASDCPANVTWSGQSGAWVAEVWGKQAEPSLFVKGTYKKGAKDVITNHAPVAFTKIVIGGVEYTAKVETMNGKKVLVLE